VADNKLGETIIIRISQNKLYLYDGLKLKKTYRVATGQLGQYPTPMGHWEIINKRINPTWVNPAKDTWGRNEPDIIPPGPDNPLGTRALDLNAPGIRIHGTPADYSIGTYASHGCIRMHIPQSEELFGLVGVGTPVIIVW
jgi:lipoprotein-anchoring transpeptidase ErfK/SrfK